MKPITVPVPHKDEWDDPDYRAAVEQLGYSEDDLFSMGPGYPVEKLRAALWSACKDIRQKRALPRGQTPMRDEASDEPLDSEWNAAAPSPPSPPPPALIHWDGRGKCIWLHKIKVLMKDSIRRKLVPVERSSIQTDICEDPEHKDGTVTICQISGSDPGWGKGHDNGRKASKFGPTECH
jgi:hypothetical protein